jgi:hypothetical protein
MNETIEFLTTNGIILSATVLKEYNGVTLGFCQDALVTIDSSHKEIRSVDVLSLFPLLTSAN